jgi:hypothetical protein
MYVDARLGGPDAQIESAAGGIPQRSGGGFGHARPPGRTLQRILTGRVEKHSAADYGGDWVGFPASAG